ncbi:MAG: hypothetical protein ACHQET_01410 [Chitinophagales bacterium]
MNKNRLLLAILSIFLAQNYLLAQEKSNIKFKNMVVDELNSLWIQCSNFLHQNIETI